jgi:hypothetical protein
MSWKIPIRVSMLALGIGCFVAGLVVAALSLVFTSAGSLPLGIVLTGLGVVLAVAGIIGFAIYGPVQRQS